MYVVLSWSTLAAVRCVEIAATENEEKKRTTKKNVTPWNFSLLQLKQICYTICCKFFYHLNFREIKIKIFVYKMMKFNWCLQIQKSAFKRTRWKIKKKKKFWNVLLSVCSVIILRVGQSGKLLPRCVVNILPGEMFPRVIITFIYFIPHRELSL